MSGKILVLGAGTGGLVAGNLLASEGYDVTIIEKSDYHLFQPGMLWIAFQGHKPEKYIKPVESLVKKNVELVKGTVSKIDLDNRIVKLEDAREYTYDYLIIALGASYDYDAIPGHKQLWETYGDYYSGANNASKLWSHFSKMKEGRLVLAAADPLYKCPPAPHKAAFLAAQTINKRGLRGKVKVTLALPFIHAYPSEVMARIVEPKLEEAGVELVTMFTVDSIDVDAGKIYSIEGDEIDFDVAAVIPVHKGPRIEVVPESVRDEDGYFKVDKHTLQVEGYDDVFAVGDCNNAPTSKTGVTAHIGGEVVVERIMGFDARFNGRTNCPIVADGEAAFVISSYEHPVIPVKFSKFKRLLEDVFIAAYWSSLRDPEKWSPVFRAYFRATDPKVLGERGW
ncbi:MAG: FAD-dependent oxidoreductase [Desulfurococcales archaeon]|nr:FAD-dependent oxidoreductase [Desulfurococcales archaeon]